MSVDAGHAVGPVLPGMADVPLSWSDAYLVGHPALDRQLQAFVRAIAALQAASDEHLHDRLRAVATHAALQFAQEDAWMSESRFPPADCHVQEHAAVSKSISDVDAVVRDGDLQEGRRLAAALADWLPAHAMHLDSALAHWLFTRRDEGRPVVIRRGVAAACAP